MTTAAALAAAGIEPATYYYAARIVAGDSPMPENPDADLCRAIDYVNKEREAMPKKPTPSAVAALVKRAAADGVIKSDNSPYFPVAGGNDQIGHALSDLVVSPDFSGLLNVDLTATIDAKWGAARMHTERTNAHFAALGLLLISLKDELQHGEFLPELERRGFEERQARRAMAYASYVFTQPQPQQMRLLEMPVTKVAALAQADPDVVEVLMEDGDTVERTTVRSLVAELKAKTAEVSNLRIEAENLAKETKLLREKKRLTQFEPQTEEVRAECFALQREAELPIDGLRKLFEGLQSMGVGGDQTEAKMRVEHVWIAAHAIAARADELIRYLADVLDPSDMPDRAHSEHYLTPEEAADWLRIGQEIQSEHEARKAIRQQERTADQPRRPGRPKGAKSKKNGG